MLKQKIRQVFFFRDGFFVKKIKEEDGRVLLLGLGACVFISTLMLLSLAVSGVYLEQRRLVRLADQAAAIAASQMDDEVYYRSGINTAIPLPIETAGAVQRASDYLSQVAFSQLQGLDNIELGSVGVEDEQVTLTLQADGKVPLLLPLVTDLFEVSLHATSHSFLKGSFG